MANEKELKALLAEARTYLEPAGCTCDHPSCGARQKRLFLERIDAVLTESQGRQDLSLHEQRL